MKIRTPFPVLFAGFVLVVAGFADALFEDQAFKFDWRQRYVGSPFKSIFFDSGSSAKILVGTESNVIAVISANTGDIRWRHLLTTDPESRLFDVTLTSNKKCSSLMAGEKQLTFQTWNPQNGALASETLISGIDRRPDFAYIFENEANAIYKDGKGLKVQAFDAKSGNLLRTVSYSLPTEDGDVQCRKSESAFACLSKEQNMIYYFSLPAELGSAINAVSLKTLGVNVDLMARLSSVEGRDGFLIESENTDVTIIDFSEGKLKGSQSFPSASTLAACGEGLLVLHRAQDKDEVVISSSGKEKVALKIGQGRGMIRRVTATCTAGRPQPFTRLLAIFQDGSISSISDIGDVFWTREEGLASLETAELVDVGDHDVFDDEGSDYNLHHASDALYSEGEHKRGVFRQFTMRMKAHATLLHAYVTHLLSVKDLSFLFVGQSSGDEFGIRKMIVCVSSKGKVYGIDSKTGNIMWSFVLAGGLVSSSKTPTRLFIQRTALHFGRDPICTLLYKSRVTRMINLVTFNPLNGKISADKELVNVGMSYSKTFLVHQHNEHFIRPLAILTRSNQLVVEPDDLGYLAGLSGKIFISSIDQGNEEKMVGQRLLLGSDGKYRLSVAWTFSSPGAKILKLIGKSTDEVVHSQGRVMADRSVLFKYINPNLGFVMAEGKDASSKTFINIYLVDLVTGHIVFSATHKRVGGPYHAVHSENWAVYTFYNEKSRRVELCSLELFEGKTQSNSTVFSSLQNTIVPLVERQSYILGPSHVTALADTKTEKAIATKHILMATSMGAIFDVPKHLLDPRRPNINTPPDQREPGLPPYIPELQLPPESILNYNQSLVSTRAIITAPTGLESTSVVFSYGLDLYCTSVTPSKGFDLLKEDFDYYVISSVLLALIGAAFVTRRLSQRKNLIQAWR